MIRIDIAHWYTAGELIHPLTGLAGARPLGEIFGNIIFAKSHLEQIMPGLKSSYASGRSLHQLLSSYLTADDFSKEVSDWEISAIAQAANNFEVNLKAELGIAPSYLVTPKGGYDINILTLYASQAFPADLNLYVSESQHDVEQAAKCLAFEVPTAAGFHLHRLNESVVHRYWDAVSDGRSRPERKTVGEYIQIMENEKLGDEIILGTLKQINRHHRNPVLHPQDKLTVQQAIELFGIIVSAVSSMMPTIVGLQESPSQKLLRAQEAFSEINPSKNDLSEVA